MLSILSRIHFLRETSTKNSITSQPRGKEAEEYFCNRFISYKLVRLKALVKINCTLFLIVKSHTINIYNVSLVKTPHVYPFLKCFFLFHWYHENVIVYQILYYFPRYLSQALISCFTKAKHIGKWGCLFSSCPYFLLFSPFRLVGLFGLAWKCLLVSNILGHYFPLLFLEIVYIYKIKRLCIALGKFYTAASLWICFFNSVFGSYFPELIHERLDHNLHC